MHHAAEARRQARLELAIGAILVALFIPAVLTAISLFITPSTSHQLLVVHVRETGGLKAGAPVRIAGVVVGRVSEIRYDPEARAAQVHLRLDASLDLPSDTTLSIVSSGMLGGREVSLQPGQAGTTLRQGGSLAQVEPALVIDDMLRQQLGTAR